MLAVWVGDRLARPAAYLRLLAQGAPAVRNHASAMSSACCLHSTVSVQRRPLQLRVNKGGPDSALQDQAATACGPPPRSLCPPPRAHQQLRRGREQRQHAAVRRQAPLEALRHQPHQLPPAEQLVQQACGRRGETTCGAPTAGYSRQPPSPPTLAQGRRPAPATYVTPNCSRAGTSVTVLS